MKLRGTSGEILETITREHPDIQTVLLDARLQVTTIKQKREIYPYQAAVLFALAKQYNQPGARILEIGTAHGYSCFFIASAAPLASIATLNPREDECAIARHNLARFQNVEVVTATSVEYLMRCAGEQLDLIFVDGDHKRVRDDFPYWQHLKPGGLMLFHDYSPQESTRPCQVVYEAVNSWCVELGKELDVVVVDDNRVGMAGIYK